MSEVKSFATAPVRIKVLGVGGGGCNALNRMVRAGIQNAGFIAVNTDVQALLQSEAPTRIQIGLRESGGLGVGGDPERGRVCAEESVEELREAVSDAHIVFIAAGMGGGTGTGATPVIARVAKESGALTIAIVTKPFSFEMARRQQLAEEGVYELEDEVDTMIIIPNDRLLATTGEDVRVDAAFKKADDILTQAVRAISEVITVPGLVNVDFADAQAIMGDSGPCWLSIGQGSGRTRVVDAAHSAISSDLIDVPIEGATGVLYVVSGGHDLTLAEVAEAAKVIEAAVDKNAMCIFGVTLEENLGDEVRITLLATNFVTSKDIAAARTAEEFRQVINGLDLDEKTLDAPAFERRPVSVRRMAKRHKRNGSSPAGLQPSEPVEVEEPKGLFEMLGAKHNGNGDSAKAVEAVPTRLMKTMLDVMSPEMVLVDSEDTVAYFNKETCPESFMRKMVGKKLWECYPDESGAEVNQMLEDFKTGSRGSTEIQVNLEERVFDVRFCALYDRHGKYLGCVGMSEQVTASVSQETQRKTLEFPRLELVGSA